MKKKENSIYKIIRQTIIFFFVLSSFCAQATKKAELKINIFDCRNSKSDAYLSELKILKNGKEFKILKPQNENIQILKELGFGTYSLVYRTIYDKVETLKVVITESKKYTTNLCINFIDYSKETYKPIIDELQEGESYTIDMLSQGCFHSTKDSLTIKRNKDIYTILWGTKSKVLQTADIENIRHFEIQLKYMSEEGCTTTDTYIVKYKEKTKAINDGSCRWNGNEYLKKQLFK